MRCNSVSIFLYKCAVHQTHIILTGVRLLPSDYCEQCMTHCAFFTIILSLFSLFFYLCIPTIGIKNKVWRGWGCKNKMTSITTNLPILTMKNYDNKKIQTLSCCDWKERLQGVVHLVLECWHNKLWEDCTSKDIKGGLEILERVHGGATKTMKVNLKMLRQQYEPLSTESNVTKAKYITHVQTMVNTMKDLGEKMVEF